MPVIKQKAPLSSVEKKKNSEKPMQSSSSLLMKKNMNYQIRENAVGLKQTNSKKRLPKAKFEIRPINREKVDISEENVDPTTSKTDANGNFSMSIQSGYRPANIQEQIESKIKQL